MKKTVRHLPPQKQEELHTIMQTINSIVRVECIILFGSYARGTWVEEQYIEDHIVYEYKSDFDILVLVKRNTTARMLSIWYKIKQQLDEMIATNVSILAFGLDEFNKHLTNGHYFFSDIKKEGIILYDSKRYKLARRKPLSSETRKQLATDDFKHWFASAQEFFDTYRFNLQKKRYNNAAFQLHQATEKFYTTVLLVFSHYKPKSHDIDELGRQVSTFDPRFLTVFPRKTTQETNCFEKLKKAYIDARYNKQYTITRKDLEYLEHCVTKLQSLTKTICLNKIKAL